MAILSAPTDARQQVLVQAIPFMASSYLQYVPYAFGLLYNHPLEGLFLDSIEALVAECYLHNKFRSALLGMRKTWEDIERSQELLRLQTI